MSRKRGFPLGSAWSRSDGSGTMRTGESARAGVAAAGGAGRGRGTRGGLQLAWNMAEGSHQARSHSRQQGVSY